MSVTVYQVYRFLNKETKVYLEGSWLTTVEAEDALTALSLDIADYSMVMTDEEPTPPTLDLGYAEVDIISMFITAIEGEWGSLTNPDEIALKDKVEAWLIAHTP